MDVLEEAVNLAFEGRPGPVHIHIPENLTHHGVEVTNYRDLRLVGGSRFCPIRGASPRSPTISPMPLPRTRRSWR